MILKCSKISNFLAVEVIRGHLLEMVAYKRCQIWLDWETFGISENWLLRRGGRLRQVVATGISTVIHQIVHLKVAVVLPFYLQILIERGPSVRTRQGLCSLKGAQSRLNGLKSLAELFKFVVCNPCQSSPSLAILFPLWFIISSLMFFYPFKVLFFRFPSI